MDGARCLAETRPGKPTEANEQPGRVSRQLICAELGYGTPEPAPAPPWHSQEHPVRNIIAENSSLRISGVVHELMYVTSS
jgi:hypothetical protein